MTSHPLFAIGVPRPDTARTVYVIDDDISVRESLEGHIRGTPYRPILGAKRPHRWACIRGLMLAPSVIRRMVEHGQALH